MSRASSAKWLQRHNSDTYVKKSKQEGYRSRAAYKLLELNKKYKLFNSNQIVVDLGAAPGGWSQYATKIVGDEGQVIACDILPMDPISGVSFLQGDFREDAVLEALLERIQPNMVDVVMSDMAPNMAGNQSVDQPRAMYLIELALDMCRQVLIPGGSFTVKVFQGESFEQYVKEVRAMFKVVKIRKPDSSRARSREVYIVATGYKG